MKTKPISAFSFLLAASVALAAPGPAAVGRCGACDCTLALAGNPAVALSAGARAALLFQIDEERMARELYAAFAAKWDLRVFRNIAQAETRHEATLRALAARAGLAAADASPGRFASAEIQRRYDALLAQGLNGAADALRAGTAVEEQDIADLRALVATTDSGDLQQIVAAQTRASEMHLTAFKRNLQRRGFATNPPAPAAKA